MTTRTKIILGVASGVAIGVVVGLLLAPDKGTATLTRVKDTAGGWADSLGDLFSKAKEQASSVGGKTRSKVSDVSEDYL